MKIKLLLIPIVCAALHANAQSIGPSILNTAGGRGIAGGTEFEYSIGEMAMVSTNTAGSITITHGILQPQPKSTEGIADIQFAKNNLLIYPNPASTEINIALKNSSVTVQTIELLDVSGKLIYQINKPILQNNLFSVPVSAIADGIYLLKINASAANKNYSTIHTISKTK
jgi:hypothetical protein